MAEAPEVVGGSSEAGTVAAGRLGWLPRIGGWLRDLTGLATEGGRVRLHTVVVMRWVAVIGQLFTLLFVHFSLQIDLPLTLALPAVLLTGAINLALARAFRANTRLGERAAALLFAYDVLQLCYLLLLTGGLQNPFSLLLLLPVSLAAATLGLAATTAVTLLTLVGVVVLAVFPGILPWRGGGLALPPLFLLGAWTALSMTTILVAIFAWNIAEEARRHADALGAIQLALAREQQLSALGAQAAAAAHLLGSPLATINVIAKELVRGLPADNPFSEEARDLLTQAQRCRDILATLGNRPAEGHPGAFARAPFSVLLADIAAQFGRPGIEVQTVVSSPDDSIEPELALVPEIRHALANLIDNAIQFANSSVRLDVETSRSALIVRIQDDGPGFSPEVLDWLGEPYLSTRSEDGGLGLGVFIATTLLARTGGKVHFANNKTGACVSIVWPGKAVERGLEERDHDR